MANIELSSVTLQRMIYEQKFHFSFSKQFIVLYDILIRLCFCSAVLSMFKKNAFNVYSNTSPQNHRCKRLMNISSSRQNWNIFIMPDRAARMRFTQVLIKSNVQHERGWLSIVLFLIGIFTTSNNYDSTPNICQKIAFNRCQTNSTGNIFISL